ncbi:hypothetical protein [Paenibacillus sp. Marseille-Q4541]|uniref:hypothetical protein n=1 Tax=Paenibacillus sp. Marseille-Q4541 TaxID=2831522 RepID=UPI001BACD9F6|nr:hypothetical protein [Paenibacillus sp. Marseille-Q4541]
MSNQEKIEQLQYELNTEKQRGAVADIHKITQLEQQIADLELEKQVEENHEEIAYVLDELHATDGEDRYTMRDLTENEAAYQILRASVQQMMMEREEKLLKEINRAKEEASAQVAQIKAEKEELQNRYDSLYEETSAIRNELNTAKEEVNELARKRDAAANELDTANKEITRLNSHIDDLRTEIAVGATNAPKVVNTNTTANLAEAMKEFKNSRPAIYDMEPANEKGSMYRATLAETGEEITFGWLEKGKYREVTAEQADQFRTSREESQSSHEDNAQLGETVEEIGVAPQPNEETTAAGVAGMDEGHTDGEVATETTKSVEERIAALELAVFGKMEEAA